MANTCWITEKAREFQKNICFIDNAKVMDCVDHNKLGNSQRNGSTRLPYLPPEKPVCRSRSKRIGHGITDWFIIGTEYDKAIYRHLAYLTYMQNTSCEMPGWVSYKLESRLQKC